MNTLKKRHDRACIVIGYYEENGNYRETIHENVKLKMLDTSITKNVYLSNDITMHIACGKEVRVFAKTLKDIEELLEIEGSPNHIKEIFDCFSEYNKSVNNDYIYTTFNLEELRREKLLPTIQF